MSTITIFVHVKPGTIDVPVKECVAKWLGIQAKHGKEWQEVRVVRVYKTQGAVMSEKGYWVDEWNIVLGVKAQPEIVRLRDVPDSVVPELLRRFPSARVV